jgi:hypothetical protein
MKAAFFREHGGPTAWSSATFRNRSPGRGRSA